MTQLRTVRCIVRGRVQGVGFRYATRQRAEQLGINGWVRNDPDGTVEVLVSGAPPDVAYMIEWLHVGPRFASVTSVTCSETERDPSASGFEVRF